RLPHLLGVRWSDRVLHDRFRAAGPSHGRRRARGRRRAGRRAEERRPTRDLHRKRRDRVHAGAVHGHAARHLQAGHHGRGRGQAGWRRCLPRADAAFYGGQEGSLLYWTVILGVLGSASLLASASLGGRVAAYAAGILASILTFFLFVLAVVASPFDVLSVTPPDGLGLNPILRDGGMLIHPPVVLAGFASFAIAFSFACAALLAGRVDAAWITHTRRFALLAWSLQTAGL